MALAEAPWAASVPHAFRAHQLNPNFRDDFGRGGGPAALDQRGTSWIRAQQLSSSTAAALGCPPAMRMNRSTIVFSPSKGMQWAGNVLGSNGPSPRLMVSAAMDASFSQGGEGGSEEYPRRNVRDPYKRLGMSREASSDELQAAVDYLKSQHGGHPPSLMAIEEAYDRIIAEKLKARRKGQQPLGIQEEILRRQRVSRSSSPSWFSTVWQQSIESPSGSMLLQRCLLFLSLTLWCLINPTENGPALQILLTFCITTYLVYQRSKKIIKTFIAVVGSLLSAWLVGCLLGPVLLELPWPIFMSFELITSLFMLSAFWFAATYVR